MKKVMNRTIPIVLVCILIVGIIPISAITASANSITCGVFKDSERKNNIGDSPMSTGASLYFHIWVDDGAYSIDYATLTVGGRSYTFNESGKDYSSIWQSTSFSSVGTYQATWTGQWTNGQSFTIWNTFTVKNPPGWSVSTTNNATSSQTLTITLKDDVGVAGYYWGTSSTSTNNSYTSVSSGTSVTVAKTVSSIGTYYLATKDIYGNLSSNTPAFTFYKTTLEPNGGSVSTSYVLTKSGNTVTLPTPTRSGYSFVGWATSQSSTTGVKSITPSANTTYYAIWKDTTLPTCSITSTNNISSSQTLTLSFSDNEGVAGYYWGTKSSYSDNSYLSTSGSSATKTITEPGTYYLTVKNTSGNISDTKSIALYKTTLNPNGGSLSASTPSYVLTANGNSFVPGTPTKSGFNFVGWNTYSTANSGSTSINPTSDATYYAVWQDVTAPTCSLISTTNTDNKQIVTIYMEDNDGIARYYWGTNATYANNPFTATT